MLQGFVGEASVVGSPHTMKTRPIKMNQECFQTTVGSKNPGLLFTYIGSKDPECLQPKLKILWSAFKLGMF